MKKVVFVVTVVITYVLHAKHADTIAGPVIHARSGDRGVTAGGVTSFRGISYTAPPVGEYWYNKISSPQRKYWRYSGKNKCSG